METPETKRTPPKAWTPNYLKGTSSHQSRVTAPSAKAKENIDAVDLFTRHDDKRPGRFSVPNGATTPPRSRAPTPPPATSHFAVSSKPIEDLEPLDDSWGAFERSRTAVCDIRFEVYRQLFTTWVAVREHSRLYREMLHICKCSLLNLCR